MNRFEGCVCCGRYIPEGCMVCPACIRQSEAKPAIEKKEDLKAYLKRKHKGEENAVKSADLEDLFDMGGRDIRRCVSALRKEGVPICSDTHKGYYYAKDQEDVNATVSRLNEFLTGIANARTGLLFSKVEDMPKIKSVRICFTTGDGPDEELMVTVS